MRTRRFCYLSATLALMTAYCVSPVMSQVIPSSNTNRPTSGDARTLAVEAHRLAKSASTLEQFTQALRVCNQALQANPSNETSEYVKRLAAWTYNKRGEALVKLADETAQLDTERAQQYEAAAIRDFGFGVQLDERNYKARFNRAVSVAMQDNYAEALKDLDVVLQQQPDHKNARFNRAEILLQLGQFSRAVADYDIVIENDPQDVTAHSGRGWALSEMGQFEDALLDMNKVVQIQPENAEAFIDRADLYAATGNWERAAGDYRVAVSLNKESARAYHNVAWLMATCPDKKYRNPELAVRAAQRAIQLEGETFRNLDTLAASYAAANNYSEALGTIQKAIATAPNAEQNELQARLALYRSSQPFIESVSSKVRLASADEPIK